MQHNNDLAAARGLASTAEEKVLWKLTAAVSETSGDIQAALHAVSTVILVISLLRLWAIAAVLLQYTCQ